MRTNKNAGFFPLTQRRIMLLFRFFDNESAIFEKTNEVQQRRVIIEVGLTLLSKPARNDRLLETRS